MAEECLNYYKICRKAAGVTQEKAAALLNVSVESIRDYEGDRRPVPDDIVCTMCEVYNAPHLALQHLRRSQVGRRAVPELELKDLPEAVLCVLSAVQKFVAKRDALVEITSDGRITQEEEKEWAEIMRLVDNLRSALVNMKFSKETK